MRLYVWRNETATNFNWIQLPLFLLISWTRKKIHSIQWNVTPVQRRLVWKISYLFICFVFGFFFFSCCLNFRLVSVFGFHPNWALCTKKSGFLTHPSQYITGQPIHSVCVLMIHFHAVCASVIGALFSNFFRLYARFSQIASLSQPTFGWCFGCVMWYEGKKANSQITMTTHRANWLLGSREKSIDEKMNTKDLQMLIVMMMVATNHGNDDVNEIENFLNYQIN